MLRPIVSRPVRIGVKHHLGLTTRFLLLSDSYGFAGVGRSLWREDGFVVYSCCWPSPAQSFSGPSPVGLATKFYCLQIWGFPSCRLQRLAGLRWRYSTPASTRNISELRQSQSYFTTGGLPLISSSWHQAPWDSPPEFVFQLNTCGDSPYLTFSLTRGRVCRLQLLPTLSGSSPAELITTFYCLRFETPPNWSSGPHIYIP
jgi:hypothetical protein